jgi:hypothetical protein
VAIAGEGLPAAKKPITSKRVLAGGDLGALFGVEMAETGGHTDASPKAGAKKGQTKEKGRTKTTAKEAKTPVAPAPSRNARAKSAKSPPTDPTAAVKPLPPADAVQRSAPNAARKMNGRSSPVAKGAALRRAKSIAGAARTSGAGAAIESKAPKITAAVRRSAAKTRQS